MCVSVLVNVVARGMAQIAAPHGLTHIDFVLLRLFLGAEELTTTHLAQALPLAPSTISRTVRRLVDRGLIGRRRLLSDRRVAILTLTAEGMALVQVLHREVQAYDARLCEGVGEEEMAVFEALTARVLANHSAIARAELSRPVMHQRGCFELSGYNAIGQVRDRDAAGRLAMYGHDRID